VKVYALFLLDMILNI